MDTYIVRKTDIETFAGLDKQHFLNNNAQRNNKSLGDLTGITGFGFHLIEVPPGKESTEFHVHKFEDECVYILEGNAEITLGDEQHSVSAGDFIGYRANGLAHTMKNIGSTPLRCIVVGERLQHDVVDYPHLNKRLFSNAGEPKNLVDIANIEQANAGKKA